MTGPGRRTLTAALAAALTAALLLLGSAACGAHPPAKPRATASPTRTPTSAPTSAPTTTQAPAPVLWPLTGVPTRAVAGRPALAVKIENSVDARPQTGLAAADMVWEEVVEGGITRYVAVYHSQLPAEIGPVRSARLTDAAIAAPLHGPLAFSGGIPAFVQQIADSGVQVISNDAGDPGFYRIGSRRAPHNVYASPQKLLAQADAAHSAPPPAQFDLAAAGQQPTAVAAGSPAGRLNLELSGVSHPRWTWSAPDGKWLRSEGSTPAVQADGTRLSATNVVVLRCDLVNTRYVDQAGNPEPEMTLTGSGRALVASGGSAVAATWAKAAVGDRFALTGPDGAPVTLAPGTTWIELVPNATGSVATS